MTKDKNPAVSFRLTLDCKAALKECEELSGLKRSAVIEVSVRRFRDELRQQAKGAPRKKGGKSKEAS